MSGYVWFWIGFGSGSIWMTVGSLWVMPRVFRWTDRKGWTK